ncbi:hypothetical protein BASA60_011544 [Batrachochytrium salamandrivorans]|nr:hypothetical protein BASA60_011544 [Batrachochytrium salamandrivorans]
MSCVHVGPDTQRLHQDRGDPSPAMAAQLGFAVSSKLEFTLVDCIVSPTSLIYHMMHIRHISISKHANDPCAYTRRAPAATHIP